MRQDVKLRPSNTTTSTDTPFSEQYNRERENGTEQYVKFQWLPKLKFGARMTTLKSCLDVISLYLFFPNTHQCKD